MGRNDDPHVCVASEATVGTGLTLTRQAQRRVVVHPCRDGYRDCPCSGDSTSAATIGTRVVDAHPLAAAGGTRGACHELAEDRLLGTPDLSRAVADRADRRLGAATHARSITALADLEAADLDVFLGAENRFLELDRQRDLDVGAAHRRPRSPRCALSAEEGLKDVREG